MKIDRLISIIMILLDKKRIGAKELAETFEVSPRTIYRDIDTINMAGIPISSIPGVGGGFEIMPNYKVDKGVFSTTDLSTILMGLSSMSPMIGSDELVNTLSKVKSFIPVERAKEIELQTNQIYIDLNPWMNNRNIKKYLDTIKIGLQEKKILFFKYGDRYGNITERITEPYQLVLKKSHWYFQGYCHKRDDFRLFKLSRISSLEITEESFIPRDYQRPQLEFDNVLETIQTTIKIRIHKSIMERALDYCSHENISTDGEEHYIVNFPFLENDYYYSILLSLGDKCECLEPLYIRKEIKHRVLKIVSIYENKT